MIGAVSSPGTEKTATGLFLRWRRASAGEASAISPRAAGIAAAEINSGKLCRLSRDTGGYPSWPGPPCQRGALR